MSGLAWLVRAGGIVAGLTLLVTAAAAAPRTWESVGASNDDNLEVYADSPDGSWCQESAAIKIVAADVMVFADGAIDDMLVEVAQKLGDQCPQMIGFEVFGYARSQDKAVYRAIAAREQGWEPMIGKAPTVDRVGKPATYSSPEPLNPPGGITLQQLVAGNTLYGEVLPDALPTRKYKPRRDTYLSKRLADSTRATTIYFDQNGTWVERVSWAQGNRARENFLTGKWSIQGDQLCFGSECFQLGRRSDGRIDLIGPDGKHYRRYDHNVPGDAESLVQARAEYVAKVERSNQQAAKLLEFLVMAGGAMGGGGGGSGGSDPCRDNPNLCSGPSGGSSPSSGGSYTAPIGGERGLYGSSHCVGPC